MKVVVINSNQKECGVYQYGLRFFQLCQRLIPEHQWEHREYPCQIEDDINLLIFNWHKGTNLGHLSASKVRNLPFKKAIIPHCKNFGVLEVFDYVLYDDCDFIDNEREIGLPRNIFKYHNTFPDDKKTIGGYGFIFPHKNFEGLINQVNLEFEEATIRIKTLRHFGQSPQEFQGMLDRLASLCKKGVSIEFNQDMLEIEGVLDYLAQNSLNVFPYIPNQGDSIGQTGTIDFALAVNRPICVSTNQLFCHITSRFNHCIFGQNTLKSIIEVGFEPFAYLKDIWNEDKIAEKVRNLICQNKELS